jgi:Zn-dependent protease/CBS domain-containing protein
MFGKGLKLFSLFGFPVRIDLSWVLIFLLLTWSLAAGVFPHEFKDMTTAQYWAMGAIAALGLFASIVLHEFGHSLVARRHGMPMKGITLFIFGGVAEMSDEPPTPRAEFQVAIAGPITSVLIGAACLGAAAASNTLNWPKGVTGVLSYVGIMNGVLVVFNLIPAFPLDGGRVLRSALWKVKNNLKQATRTTSRIGMGFGVVLIVLGVLSIVTGNLIGGIWWVLIGLFLRGAAQSSYQQLLVRRVLEGEPVRQFMATEPITVPPTATIRDVVEHYMYQHHHRMFPVTENGALVGCITSREIRAVPRDQWEERVVRDVAHTCSDENTIEADADAVEALKKMQRDGASRLMVVEGGKLQGTLTLKDLLKFLSLKLELEEDMPGHLPAGLQAARPGG